MRKINLKRSEDDDVLNRVITEEEEITSLRARELAESKYRVNYLNQLRAETAGNIFTLAIYDLPDNSISYDIQFNPPLDATEGRVADPNHPVTLLGLRICEALAKLLNLGQGDEDTDPDEPKPAT